MKMRSPATLWALLAVQALCAVFFVFDAGVDALGIGGAPLARGTQLFEYALSLALVGGIALTVICLREMLARQAALRRQVAVASGAFEDLLQSHFRQWDLTPSEEDVARLAIKGLSVAEMAAVRGSSEGTIKAHSAAVYRKAGVSGRLQLISLFIEELMADPPLAGNAEG
jgi:DNA-binding NarL/FixJ family response regulator